MRKLLQAYVKGTNTRIIGTSETVLRTCMVAGFDEDHTPEFTGDDEICWDTSEQIVKNGELMYTTEDFEDVPESEIEFREGEIEDDDDEEDDGDHRL